MMGWLGDYAELLIGSLIFCVVILFIAAVFANATAPTFSLKKADWQCTASHDETWVQMVDVSGKGTMMIPVIHTDSVCDKWERKK